MRCRIKGSKATCKVKSATAFVKSTTTIDKSKAMTDKSKAMILVFQEGNDYTREEWGKEPFWQGLRQDVTGSETACRQIRAGGRIYWGGRPYICGREPVLIREPAHN